MRRRTRLVGAGAALAVAAAAAVATQVGAAPGTVGHAAAQVATPTSGGGGQWVTLVTGDRVLLRDAGGGRTSVTVDAARRTGLRQFTQFTRHGDQYVLPTDAAQLVGGGVLDEELFNVSGLVRQGYDDAHTRSLPLLVRYADRRGAAHPVAPKGARLRRALPAAGMAAIDAAKDTAAGFWTRSLTTRAGGNRPASAGRLRLAAGVEKVWLNRRVHADLDQSVPQIGAPTAWERGLTGDGVTVAVLDTGVDTHHPDLAGRIGQVRDFTGAGSVEDGHGHGTHVASIVAGSGAASDGRYKGVAPGVTLAVGKVLDDNGGGTFDSVVGGMEWAAGSGARVVNMSLGAGPTDGTDPVSEALNTLTSRYGTLFVVAAGNHGDGTGDESVSTPAAADAALAVASVDKTDVPSDFSNRGPRVGDGAAKPDLAAPGGGIVAARAAGAPLLGEPVDDAYQRLSGTSMAAPHVSGAAALLAQQHPDWTAARLKSALMSTAAEVPGAGPYTVGTGRVDVARATAQPVTATGSVSTFLRWPNQGLVRTQPATWHNSGTEPVTLHLSATLTGGDGQPAPAGMLALSADTVTVPAGGDASVQVTVTGQDGAAGHYSGVLVGTAGPVVTRTVLSVYQEQEMHDLTVDLLDRTGAPAPVVDYPNVSIVDLDHGNPILGGPGVFALPRGRYAVHATIETPRAGQESSVSLVTHPDLTLDHDTALTLDARVGQPMSATPDDPAARGGVQTVDTYDRIADCECTFAYRTDLDPRFRDVYAATVPGTSSPSFGYSLTRQAHEPLLEVYADDGQPFEVEAGWFDPMDTPEGQATLPAVYGGSGTPEDLAGVDARDKLVVFEIPREGISFEDLFARTTAIRDAGGRMALAVFAAPDTVTALGGGEPAGPSLPLMTALGVTGQRLVALARAGGTPVSYVNRPFPPRRYELAYTGTDRLDTPQVHAPATDDLVAVRTSYHDNSDAFGSSGAHRVWASQPFFGASAGSIFTLPVRDAVERTEYFTPGTWDLGAQSGPGAGEASEHLSLRPDRDYHVVWNKAVAGPSLRGTFGTGEKTRPWAWRSGGALDLFLPMFGDSDGRPLLPWSPYDSGSVTLYRDGQEVGSSPAPDSAWFEVPDEAADYRVVARADRNAPWWPLSTSVRATWTFRSSAEDEGRPLPLLTVRFDPKVDLRNRAPGGGPFTFPAFVTRQDTDRPEVGSLTVDVSYDDGRTWQRADVAQVGDHWNVRVVHPATGYATLRARATDTDGNAVEQTVVHAYQVGQEPARR